MYSIQIQGTTRSNEKMRKQHQVPLVTVTESCQPWTIQSPRSKISMSHKKQYRFLRMPMDIPTARADQTVLEPRFPKLQKRLSTISRAARWAASRTVCASKESLSPGRLLRLPVVRKRRVFLLDFLESLVILCSIIPVNKGLRVETLFYEAKRALSTENKVSFC
jgi:hypothetical protein